MVPEDYCVRAISVAEEIEDVFKTMNLKAGDIILWVNENVNGRVKRFEYGNDYVDLKALFDSRGRERWWSNAPIHLIELGSRRVAEVLFSNCIRAHLKGGAYKTIRYASQLEEDEIKGINSYVCKYKNFIQTEGTCGAIVMNCNPYTIGHDYLIRSASKEVDWLYVFVVEENKSFFPFSERFELVKKNTSNIKNVIVLPSGKMILSVQTLPAYFFKETHQDINVDVSMDLRLFALGIAPAFRITQRFVGEESFDNVTRKYNECMKEMLPLYGIKLTEIPRLVDKNGIVISATRVRMAINDKRLEDIKKDVTEITYQFLEEKYYN